MSSFEGKKHPEGAPYKCYVYGTQQACWVDIIDGNRGRQDKRMGDTGFMQVSQLTGVQSAR